MSRRLAFFMLMILGIPIIVASHQFPVARAVTSIGGHITFNTTWSPVDTYRVINDTYVDSGVTLTILPSVYVQFADGSSLIVQGSLNATGTDTEPIVFTSSRSSPGPGVWKTIEFVGDSNEQLSLQHAKIQYAIDGVIIHSTALATIQKSKVTNCSNSGIAINGESNVLIEGNTIEQNRYGIVTDSSDTHEGIVIINNTISRNQWYGICLYSYCGSGGSSLICNVSIVSNTILCNAGTGIDVWSNGGNYGDGIIHDLGVSSNAVLSNGAGGIVLGGGGGYTGDLYNIAVSSNKALCNTGEGIDITSTAGLYGGGLSYIFNASISGNTASANSQDGMHFLANNHYMSSAYDLEIWNNTVSANGQKGIGIDGALSANLINNSVSYNMFGVFYTTLQSNSANYNDIYDNSYGMNVTSGYLAANINATYDYWGDSTGPYHPSLNPNGRGNSVNGNGNDLVFIPFLTSSHGYIDRRPIAALSINDKTPGINETVTLSANSTGYGRIDYYFFDFGDASNSSWTSLPVVTHTYSNIGTYYATVTVMDDCGLASNNTQQIKIRIIVVPEFPASRILALFMLLALAVVVLSKKGSVKSSTRALPFHGREWSLWISDLFFYYSPNPLSVLCR
jgi:parallel beta-helix repeat protein